MRKIVRKGIHVVARPRRTRGRTSLVGLVWWQMIGAVVRICVRIADTVQRAIKASTHAHLVSALATLRRRGFVTQEQTDAILSELSTMGGEHWQGVLAVPD